MWQNSDGTLAEPLASGVQGSREHNSLEDELRHPAFETRISLIISGNAAKPGLNYSEKEMNSVGMFFPRRPFNVGNSGNSDKIWINFFRAAFSTLKGRVILQSSGPGVDNYF